MDPKYVNRFTRSFEVEQELYRYMHLTSTPIIVSLALIATVLLVDVAAGVLYGMNYANMAVFAMAVIVLLILFYRYYSAVKAAKSRFEEDTNNKGEVTVTATITEDRLISESSDREEPVEVPFRAFQKAFVTKHYYMIYTDERMVYAFRKGAFTVGDEAGFFPYIRQLVNKNKH